MATLPGDGRPMSNISKGGGIPSDEKRKATQTKKTKKPKSRKQIGLKTKSGHHLIHRRNGVLSESGQGQTRWGVGKQNGHRGHPSRVSIAWEGGAHKDQRSTHRGFKTRFVVTRTKRKGEKGGAGRFLLFLPANRCGEGIQNSSLKKLQPEGKNPK